ncbi:MAG: radical SAM protein [Lachnospiraceae bacterium]|nr:radical SAM protein [Lachnospiraceae bacterium]
MQQREGYFCHPEESSICHPERSDEGSPDVKGILRCAQDDSGCRLCPRMCGVDRTAGQTGFCGCTDQVRIARAALHFYEEPCISGTRGAGTVFFTGCTLRCVYCQNAQISRRPVGRAVSVPELAEIFLDLQEQGAHNIDLVTPTQFSPQIASAVELAREKKLVIPIVYNTSGYERPEVLEALADTVDVWMPDFKYWKSETAAALSAAPDYPEAAKAALAEMVRQQPKLIYDEDGLLQKGVLVRILVLPGHVKEAVSILRYLAETYEDRILISLMSQYTPMPRMASHPLLSRKLTKREYERVLDEACRLELSNVFIQEGDAAKDSFIPPFEE